MKNNFITRKGIPKQDELYTAIQFAINGYLYVEYKPETAIAILEELLQDLQKQNKNSFV